MWCFHSVLQVSLLTVSLVDVVDLLPEDRNRIWIIMNVFLVTLMCVPR